MAIDRNRARRAFATYVKAYDPDDPKIALKVAHTWKVAGLCDQIAHQEGFAPELQDLAWLCGLLHDVGRFEQVRRYDTFYDAKSVSHAALGVEVLFGDARAQEGAPAQTSMRDFCSDDAYDEAVRQAVGLHSAYELPDDLDERALALCNVVRDADKVDILRVNCACPPEDVYGLPEGELRQSPLSDEVEREFYRHRTVRADLRRHPADILVSHACFVWGLVYPTSVRLAREQGFALRMLSRPIDNPETVRRMAAMHEHMEMWFSGR